ncbi:MAG: hypothetical protein ABSG01_00365 [Anaerolineales bacterium]
MNTNRLDRFQGKATGKYGQPVEQGTFSLPQQIVAPVQGRPQGLLTRQDRVAATRQQVEVIAQPG